MDDEIVVVRTYLSEVEAHIAQAALASSGIPSIVLPDNAGGMLPMLQVLFPIRLAVRSDDQEAAIAVLDAPPGVHDVDAEADAGPEWDEERE